MYLKASNFRTYSYASGYVTALISIGLLLEMIIEGASGWIILIALMISCLIVIASVYLDTTDTEFTHYGLKWNQIFRLSIYGFIVAKPFYSLYVLFLVFILQLFLVSCFDAIEAERYNDPDPTKTLSPWFQGGILLIFGWWLRHCEKSFKAQVKT